MTINAGDTPDADDLNALALPGQLIAYGQRTTDKTYTGTEVGVIRLDNVSMLAGYRYWITTSNLRLNVTSGETGHCNLRYNTGGTATTSSTVLTAASGNANSAFTPVQSPIISCTLAPGAATVSILLCLSRSGGSNNVTMTGSSTQPIELYVWCAGPDPGDSGTDI